MRLDLYLVEKNYFKTRTKAVAAIKENVVSVNGKIITKQNYEVSLTDEIVILKEVNPYVSRGGLKLEAAIQSFYLDFQDKIILDIGASTGGFTDCALKHGAKLIYAVDVGTDQLDSSLRNLDQVVVMEQTNILDVLELPVIFDFVVMDVSFVSIEKILPAIDRFLTPHTALVCLIKPQFEVGKMYLKHGVVKDKSLHIKVLEKISKALGEYQMGIYKLIPSPILGGSGNKEFLAYVKRNVQSKINFIEICK